MAIPVCNASSTSAPQTRRNVQKHSALSAVVLFLLFVAVIVVQLSVVSIDTAYAYTLTGQKWASSSKVIDGSALSGNYSSALNSANAQFNAKTDVTISRSSSSTDWTALTGNYGNTQWEGYSTWNYTTSTGKITSAISRVNTQYASSYSLGCLKVLWEHELCHVWGLGHVSSYYRVMYQSASDAYNLGSVHNLTSDEISGINSLY